MWEALRWAPHACPRPLQKTPSVLWLHNKGCVSAVCCRETDADWWAARHWCHCPHPTAARGSAWGRALPPLLVPLLPAQPPRPPGSHRTDGISPLLATGPSCYLSMLCCLKQPRGHSPGPTYGAGLTLLRLFFLLQDPTNLDKFNVSNFFHVKNNMKMTDPGTYGQSWCGGQSWRE